MAADMSTPASSNTTAVNDTGAVEGSVVDAEHIALYLMLSFFSVLGVVGNAIAFYIFFLRRNTGTSVIFILALAGTDFITCLVTVPYTIVFEAMRYRLYYDGLCKMYMFFITSTIPFSSLIMAGIAFDRYFCICHPFLHVLNVQRARFVVLGLFLPACTFGIITGMSYGMFLVQDYLLVNGSVLLGTDLPKALVQQADNETFFLDVSQLYLVPGGRHQDRDFTFFNDSRVHRVQTYRILVHNAECTMNNFYFSDLFQAWFHRVYTSCYILSFVVVMVLYVLIYKSIFTRRAMKAKRRKKNYYTSVAVTDAQAPAPRTTKPPATTATETKPVEGNQDDTAMTELNGNGAVVNKATSDESDNTTTATTTTRLLEERRTSAKEKDDGGSSAEKDKEGGTKDTNGTTANNTEPAAVAETARVPKRRGSTTRDRNLYANIKTAMMLFVVTLVFIVAFAPAWFMAHNLIPVQLNVFYMYFVYNVANPFIYAFMNQSFREDLKKLLKRS